MANNSCKKQVTFVSSLLEKSKSKSLNKATVGRADSSWSSSSKSIPDGAQRTITFSEEHLSKMLQKSVKLNHNNQELSKPKLDVFGLFYDGHTDVDDFIHVLKLYINAYKISEEQVIAELPIILKGRALTWCVQKDIIGLTLEDVFCEMRLHFDDHVSLPGLFRYVNGRKQKNGERIISYLDDLHRTFKKMNPRLCPIHEITIAWNGMIDVMMEHCPFKSDYSNFYDFYKEAKKTEIHLMTTGRIRFNVNENSNEQKILNVAVDELCHQCQTVGFTTKFCSNCLALLPNGQIEQEDTNGHITSAEADWRAIIRCSAFGEQFEIQVLQKVGQSFGGARLYEICRANNVPLSNYTDVLRPGLGRRVRGPLYTGQVPLEIHGMKYKINFVTGPKVPDCIVLGIDFLFKYNVTIKFSTHTLSTEFGLHHEIPFCVLDDPDDCVTSITSDQKME